MNNSVFAKSLTITSKDGKQFIDGLPCGNDPFTISATPAYVANHLMFQIHAVGQCVLTNFSDSGVVLGYAGNSVSVVFPNDFTCPTY
ncbi:MAG: hypothetical protein ACRCXC_04780 [Legionella sp.]